MRTRGCEEVVDDGAVDEADGGCCTGGMLVTGVEAAAGGDLATVSGGGNGGWHSEGGALDGSRSWNREGKLTHKGNGNQSGHTRIFEWNTNTWIQKGVDIDGESPGDLSGINITISDGLDILTW